MSSQLTVPYQKKWTVTPTGSNGSATITVPIRFLGLLRTVQYSLPSGTQPAGCVVLLREKGTNMQLMTNTGALATPIVRHPRLQAHDTSGSAITGVYFQYGGVSNVDVEIVVTVANTTPIDITLTLDLTEWQAKQMGIKPLTS